MQNRFLPSLLIVSLAFSVTAPSFALPAKPVYSADVALLASHLNELELTGDLGNVGDSDENAKRYRNTREFIVGMVNDFSNHGWCPERSDADYSRLLCLQERFSALYKKALSEGALDTVETAVLNYYIEAFTFTDSRVFDIDSNLLSRLGNPKRAPKRDQVIMPQLTDYRFKKLGLVESRKAKEISPDGELDPELVALISNHYKKKIRGIGRVNAIEAITVKYGRNALGELSTIMKDAIWFWTSDMKLTGTKSGATRELQLTRDDMSGIVLNDLLYQLEQRPNEDTSYLSGENVVLDDAVIAAVLTGEMDLNWARGILASPEFKQPKPDRSKFLGYLNDLARTLLITQPELLPFYSLGSIIFESIKRNKADRTEYNNETRRIPIRTIR